MKYMSQKTLTWMAGLLIFVLGITSTPSPLSATPNLSGNLADLFTVDPVADCPSCSAAELDTLQQGLSFAFTRLRRESLNHQGEVCVVEGSLIRDLAILTYTELRLTGQISHGRWYDLIKAKAKISGALSPITREMLLLRFQDLSADRLSSSSPNLGGALDLYGAASFATVFRLMAEDRWDAEDWLAELGRPMPSARAGNAKSAQTHGILNQAIIASRAEDIWMHGQLGHLLSLPDDFSTPAVASAVDTLHQSYQSAIDSNFATVMRNGCGVQAGAAMLEHLANAATAATTAAAKGQGQRFQDDTIVVIELSPGLYVYVNLTTGEAFLVHDVITVTGDAPPGGPTPGSPYDNLEPEIGEPDLGPGSVGTNPSPPGFGPTAPTGPWPKEPADPPCHCRHPNWAELIKSPLRQWTEHTVNVSEDDLEFP